MDKAKIPDDTDALGPFQKVFSWDKATEGKFKILIGKMPVFLRSMAEQRVCQKAESIAREDHRVKIPKKIWWMLCLPRSRLGFKV